MTGFILPTAASRLEKSEPSRLPQSFHQMFSLDQVMQAASRGAVDSFAAFFLCDLRPSEELGNLVFVQAFLGQPTANT